MLFQDFLASEEARLAHWQYKAEGHAEFAQARPNPAHRALVALERLGKLDTLVTQNVDGLHQDAGHDPERIVELHGTNRFVECLSCGERSAPEPALEEFQATGECPRCRACGGILKTATVSFGQPMPQAELQRAFRAARRADLALAIGSTLEVRPAADVPLAAVGNGARYAIINRGPTGHDQFADLRLEGDVTVILPALLRALGAPARDGVGHHERQRGTGGPGSRSSSGAATPSSAVSTRPGLSRGGSCSRNATGANWAKISAAPG